MELKILQIMIGKQFQPLFDHLKAKKECGSKSSDLQTH